MSLAELSSAIDHHAAWMPDPLKAALMMMLAAGLALLLRRTVLRALRRLISPKYAFLRSLVEATSTLSRFALVIIAVAVVLPIAPLGAEPQRIIAHLLFAAFIVLLGWSAAIALTLATNLYLWRLNVAEQSGPLARKHVTQVHVLRRVMATLVIVITVAAALMTFNSVKQYGISLIASALRGEPFMMPR